MTREFERVTCPGCGRQVSAYVPHMGDGSALRTMKHLVNHPGGVFVASPTPLASVRCLSGSFSSIDISAVGMFRYEKHFGLCGDSRDGARMSNQCDQFSPDGSERCTYAYHRGAHSWARTTSDPIPAPVSAPDQASKPVRMWVLDAPFNKRGVPLMGQFGSRSGHVVIFTVSEWKRLCENVPQLQTTQFEVGSYE